jgi:hypothetical protein
MDFSKRSVVNFCRHSVAELVVGGRGFEALISFVKDTRTKRRRPLASFLREILPNRNQTGQVL